MGQQQLLPLVLAALIISVAILRGLEIFKQERTGARHEEEIRQYLLETAARSQTWYRRPASMGGGGQSFEQITWKKINVEANTPFAKFSMAEKQRDRFTLIGVSREDTTIVIKYQVAPGSVSSVP